MIRTVEQRGQIQLCCYGFKGWAVFKYAPGDEGTAPGWKCVINGKFDDVIERYLLLTLRN